MLNDNCCGIVNLPHTAFTSALELRDINYINANGVKSLVKRVLAYHS